MTRTFIAAVFAISQKVLVATLGLLRFCIYIPQLGYGVIIHLRCTFYTSHWLSFHKVPGYGGKVLIDYYDVLKVHL